MRAKAKKRDHLLGVSFRPQVSGGVEKQPISMEVQRAGFLPLTFQGPEEQNGILGGYNVVTVQAGVHLYEDGPKD